MARSFDVERPTTGFGSNIQYGTPVLGDARLPEAEPKFTSFLPSHEEIRKKKLQESMMIDREQQIAQLKAVLGGPMKAMGYENLPMFDALDPESMVDMANQFGFQGDTGVGLLDTGMYGPQEFGSRLDSLLTSMPMGSGAGVKHALGPSFTMGGMYPGGVW